MSMENLDGHLSVWQSLYRLCYLGLPTAISFTATTLANTISFSFVGAYSNEEVQAGHGLGFSIGNMLVLTVALGLVNGMDTLCPLAIGAGHREGCWAHLFQALGIVGIAIPLLMPLVFFSSNILTFLRQDPVVSKLAEQYLIAGLPGLIFICIFEALRKFLIYHQDYPLQTIVSVLTIPIQVLFLYLFIGVMNLGVIGAGYARSVATLLVTLALLFYIILQKESFGWTRYLHPEQQNAPVLQQEHISFCHIQAGQNDTDRSLSTTTEETRGGNVISQNSDPSATRHVEDRVDIQTSSYADLAHQISLYTAALPSSSRVVSSSLVVEMSAQRTSLTVGANNNNNVATSSIEDISLLQQALAVGRKCGDCCWNHLSDNCEADSNKSSSSIHRLLDHYSIIKVHQHWWQGIPHFFRIALPSTFLCVFEWVAFEVQIFVAAYLGTIELSAIAASAALSSLIFILSLSVAVTLNGEIGRAMGSRMPKDAYTLAKAGCLASACISVPIVCVVLASRKFIAKFYSASPEIGAVIVRNLLFQAPVIMVVKALNLQRIGCVFDAIGLLGIMQLVGSLIAFKTPLLGSGFLIGTAVGVTCVLIGYIFLLFNYTNWDRKSKGLVGTSQPDNSVSQEGRNR